MVSLMRGIIDVMFDLAASLLARLDAGRPVAVATIVRIEGSSPRGVGASMAWDGDAVLGSLSGGCIEGATLDVAAQVLADGQTREISWGAAETDDPLDLVPRLSCGGRLDLRIERISPADTDVIDALRAAIADRPRLAIVGAMQHAATLAAMARAADWRVTVVDPRELFLSEERFPGVERLIGWPPRVLAGLQMRAGDAICLLGHDDRHDAETLLVALRSGAGFVGAMGSMSTVARRRKALLALGATADELQRLHSPIGLRLGSNSPTDVAVSILAQLVEREADRSRPNSFT